MVTCVKNWDRLDSVIFDTESLETIREFYEVRLGMEIAEYERDGETVQDFSAAHVNYNIGGSLLGFETEKACQTGSLVLRTTNLADFRARLVDQEIQYTDNDWFIAVTDPEGRQLIVEETGRGPKLC